MKRGTISYSEAFKMQVVEQMSSGKFTSISEAQRAYGISGMTTIQKWIKKYGREDLLPKRVRIETMAEIDELKEAKKRIRVTCTTEKLSAGHSVMTWRRFTLRFPLLIWQSKPELPKRV